jgi:rfaE bifunctional protein kinase chain/domain
MPMTSANNAAELNSAQTVRELAGAKRNICFVSGNFNVVHPGHLRLLKFAAEVGDFVVVGLAPDGSQGVTVSSEERLESMKALSFVNHALLLSGPAAEFISRLKPEFVVMGKEFEDRETPEAAAVAGYGGSMLFSSGETRFSSMALLDSEFLEADLSTIEKPTGYPRRHGFEIAGLKSHLSKFSGLRTLVIGDLIVDDYVTCDPVGMSQEDPTIVVTPIETKTFVGGAGVVAAHASSLGADVSFMTVTGADETADFALQWLKKSKIETIALRDATRPTTRKQRFRAHGKTLLRVNHLRQHAIGADLIGKMLASIDRQLARTDLLLFADFNYGCLPQNLVDAIIERAKARKIMMSADSQASSQMSDVSRFKHMDLLTPTEREARLAVRDPASGLAILAEQLSKKANAKTVLITLGSEGLMIYANKRGSYTTDRLPAFNRAPKDAAGAGDSLFTCTSLAMRAGVDVWEASYLGALAAACQVGRVGNAPLSLEILNAEIDAPNTFSLIAS